MSIPHGIDMIVDNAIPPPIEITKDLKMSRSKVSKLERERLANLKVQRDHNITKRALSLVDGEIGEISSHSKSLIERAFILGACKAESKNRQEKRKEKSMLRHGNLGYDEFDDGSNLEWDF